MSVLLDSKSSLLQIKGDVAAEEIVPKEVLVELDLAKHEIQYHSLVSKAELVLKDMSDTIAEVEIGELHNHVSSSSIGLSEKKQIINRAEDKS